MMLSHTKRTRSSPWRKIGVMMPLEVTPVYLILVHRSLLTDYCAETALTL